MIDRWHLDLAALGLYLGVIVVVGVVAVSMGWTGRENSAAQRGAGSPRRAGLPAIWKP
ncbi:MAG: hypothetical protein V9F03_05650 [Microthrixaceae bacterium]